MATYTINNKDYELQCKNISKTIWPNLLVELVAEGEEPIVIYQHDCDQYDGCPEMEYAGGGMFWDASSFDGEKVTPERGAVKISPDEWVKKAACDMADYAFEYKCVFPDEDECMERGEIIEEVDKWLKEQYRIVFGLFIDSWVENRIKEETEEQGA